MSKAMIHLGQVAETFTNSTAKMQCLSFSFPRPTTPFSPVKQHKLYSFLSISSAQSKRNQSNTSRHTTLVRRPIFPEVLATKVNLQAQESSPGGLEPEFIPKHVAIIMDGNRRWALKRGLAVELGYIAGARLMKELACLCSKLGVKVLTLFAISTENWVRPQKEIDFLMTCLEEQIESDLEDYMREGIKTSITGDTSKLPESLQNAIALVEETTKANTGLHLMIGLNYSGRQDIMRATKIIASKVKDGEVLLEDINDKLFEEELQTKCSEFPNPDLLIRTSGEQRLSNFMLWQLAYTELFFVDKLFPDFEEADLINALSSFQRRQRRFGGYEY